MRDWLPKGAIPDDKPLLQQLVARDYTFDKKQKIVLVPKEIMEREGKDSPDEGDGLAITFAYPAVSKKGQRVQEQLDDDDDGFYNPIGSDRFATEDA
jgi:hypothetical protein